MAQPGLLFGSFLGLVASASFTFAATRLGRREGGKSSEPLWYFRVWWYGIALYAFLVGFLLNGLAGLGWTDVRTSVVVRTMTTTFLCGSMWGLTYYVSYLYSGRTSLRLALGIYFLATYAFIVGTLALSTAVGVRVGAYDTQIVYSPPIDPRAFAVVLALLSAPQLVAAIAFLALALRTDEPLRRYRIVLAGASLIVWLGASLVAGRDLDSPLLLARPLLGVLASLMVVLAYAPPAWVERRIGAAASLSHLVG